MSDDTTSPAYLDNTDNRITDLAGIFITYRRTTPEHPDDKPLVDLAGNFITYPRSTPERPGLAASLPQTLEELVASLPGELDSDAWWAALNDAYNDAGILQRIKITQTRIAKLTGIPERTVKRKLKKLKSKK